jgi:hypothetical protein
MNISENFAKIYFATVQLVFSTALKLRKSKLTLAFTCFFSELHMQVHIGQNYYSAELYTVHTCIPF